MPGGVKKKANDPKKTEGNGFLLRHFLKWGGWGEYNDGPLSPFINGVKWGPLNRVIIIPLFIDFLKL